jgi:hypothetical protein
MDFISSGILGSLFGGLFRLFPEVLKFFDKKNERSHELNMFKLQTDLEKLKGEFKVEERYVDYSVAQMEAIKAAAEAEGKIASQSYKWVSALVALVRPVITYTIFGLYVAVKLTFISYGLTVGNDWATVLAKNWTTDDFGILMMILTFHFVGRPIEKYTKGS